MRDEPEGSKPAHDGGGCAILPTPAPPKCQFITTAITAEHVTSDYKCAYGSYLEDFLKKDALRLANIPQGEVFVCPYENDRLRVSGYYYISYGCCSKSNLPKNLQGPVSSKAPVAFVVIAALSRDASSEHGLGLELIVDIVRRAQSKGGIWGISLWAANKKLVEYYKKFNFYLPKKEAERMEEEARNNMDGENYQMFGCLNEIVSSKDLVDFFLT